MTIQQTESEASSTGFLWNMQPFTFISMYTAAYSNALEFDEKSDSAIKSLFGLEDKRN